MMRGARRTNCSTEACRRNLRCIFCRTRRQFALWNPALCCTFSINGRCARASTRRKRFTSRQWKKWSKCARCFPTLRVTSAHPVTCVPEFLRPSALRVHTFAARKCGSTSRTSNEGYDSARQPDLLPYRLDLRLFFHEPCDLDQG